MGCVIWWKKSEENSMNNLVVEKVAKKVVGKSVDGGCGIVGKLFGFRKNYVRFFTKIVFGGKVLQEDFHVRFCLVYVCYLGYFRRISTVST